MSRDCRREPAAPQQGMKQQELIQEIIAVFKNLPGANLTAKDILNHLGYPGLTKGDINRILYALEKERRVVHDPDSKDWSLAA